MDVMKSKTIQIPKLSNFGFVKLSEYPTKRELNEFKFSMFILLESNLFYFYEKKNKTDIIDNGLSVEHPKEIKLTLDALGKIQDLFNEVTLNKCYQLTGVSLNNLLGIIENNPVTLKINYVTLQTKRKSCTQIDFPQIQPVASMELPVLNSTNQSIDEVDRERITDDYPVNISDGSDAEFRKNINKETKRFSSEINKSIQDFLKNINSNQSQNSKTNSSPRPNVLRVNDYHLLEQLKLDLTEKENEYNALLYSLKKIAGEVYRKGPFTEKERSIILAGELAKIESATSTQIQSLFSAASVEQYNRKDLALSNTIKIDSVDVDLSKIFPEKKSLHLIKQLHTINSNHQTDLNKLVMEVLAVLNQAILKINQMYSSDITDKVTDPNVESSNYNDEDFAQKYVDLYIEANKKLKEMKEQVISQLNSFEEDGYLPYISEKHRYKAREFAQDPSGIYFNEINTIRQEIEKQEWIAAKITRKMIIDIHNVKSERVAMAEIALYLNSGIDFSDLKRKFITTKTKFEDIQKNKSSFTQHESGAMQKKIDYFMQLLQLEQSKRQKQIKDFESLIDNQLALISSNNVPYFIIELIGFFKQEINAYKACDTSLNDLVRNINCSIPAFLTQANLEGLPYYGNQNKEFLLTFFNVTDLVLNLLTTDSKKRVHFFSQEIKEIEYTKSLEQLTSIIVSVAQLLREQEVANYY
jgi:hypothetical protein